MKASAALRAFILLFGVPVLLGGLVYAGLLLQPRNTWRWLMPAATFARPYRGLRALILLKEDMAGDLMPLHEAQYFYPDGERAYLIAKEKAKVMPWRGGTGGWSEAYCVDADGSFFRFRSPDGTLQFEATNGIPPEVRRLIDDRDSLILSQDEPTLATLAGRLPILQPRRDSVVFSDDVLTLDGAADLTLRYDTRVGAGVWLRVSVFLGLFVAAAVSFLLLAESADPLYRPVLTLLSFPAVVVLLCWTTLATSVLGWHLFGALPYVLWLLLGAAAGALLVSRAGRVPRTLLQGVLHVARPRLISLLVAGALIVYAGVTVRTFFRDHLTMGDSVKFVRSALYIYDQNRWPLDRVVEDLGHDSLHAVYPPGVSTMMALSLWIVAPGGDRLLFPGQQTGAVWLLYGVFLMAANLLLIAAAVLTARALVPGHPSLWVATAVFVLAVVPSTRGELHAGESILWPVFGMTLIAATIWRRTGEQLAAGTTLALMIGLPLLKSEGLFLSALLVGPIAFAALPTLRPRRGFAIVLFLSSLLAIVPLMAYNIQKTALGVVNPAYHPVSLSGLAPRLGLYPRALKTTFAIAAGRHGSQYAPYPVAFLLLMAGALVWLQATRFSWRRFLLPLGVVAYCLAVPAVYIFSTWSPLELIIISSWGRLLVPVTLTAGLFLLDNAADALGAPR